MCQPKESVQQLQVANFVLPRIENGLRNWLHTTGKYLRRLGNRLPSARLPEAKFINKS